MIVTTWDGQLRLDRVADGALLTLLTTEPTTEAALRTGLTAAFVTADPDGPPARVRTVLAGDRLPTDIAALVGPRIAAAVQSLDGAGAWLRLDLAEVDDLAESWAPYRVRVLDPAADRPAVGSWPDGLWTALGLDWSWLTRPSDPAPAFRGTEQEPGEASGGWPVPESIARACGCGPVLLWRARRSAPDEVELSLSVERGTEDPRAELLAAVDLPDAEWVALRPAEDGTLRARLLMTGAELPALRLRARIGGRP